MKQLLGFLITIVTIAYPLIFFFGLSHFNFRTLLFAIAIPLLLRFFIFGRHNLKALVFGGIALIVFALLLIQNDPRYFMLTPVAVNLGLLWTFGASLFTEQCFVERLARMQAKELSPPEISYCKVVNGLWCLFFIINATLASYIVWIDDMELWALYNGLLAYAGVGVFFTLEYLYRHWRFRRYFGAWTDPMLKKIFPEQQI